MSKKNEKIISSTYLVAIYLKTHRTSKICNMKTKCNANNIGQRVLQLRKLGWKIDTVKTGVKAGVQLFAYEVKKVGTMPTKYRLNCK